MKITIITPFPDIVESPIHESILKQAQKKTDLTFQIINPRDFAEDKHKVIDDYPYGGGFGMVLKPEPLFGAIEFALKEFNEKPKIIYPSPQGKLFNQEIAKKLATEKNFVFICGRYKGIDQRVIDTFVDEEISIGDYIISGGELASLVIIDAIVRLQPGVLNHIESAETDTFSEDLFDAPYYTRPEVFRNMKVPDVLLSGHHKKIEEWRLARRIEKTKRVRPDLYDRYCEKNKQNGG
ncbi:MAG: tRNA (guanosine(37)-N1)-methyltransferase TrmD [Calditrichia bacterium]